MPKNKRKSIYINAIPVGWAIFQTQVLDWLHLYQKYQLEFELIHTLHLKELRNPANIRRQLKDLRKNTGLFSGYYFWLPSRSILYVINAFVLSMRIFRYAFQYDEILIFSRGLIGKEIGLLKKIFPGKIIFIYDARGASGEENKFNATEANDFSLKRYRITADTFYLEFKTLLVADKVFVVSQALEKYYRATYNMQYKKYVLYPCLSDTGKFYYDPGLREKVRNELKLGDDTKVFIYSGGIGAWHAVERMFTFFVKLLNYENNSVILFLTQNRNEIEKIIDSYPEMKNKYMIFSVSNKDVVKYLNASDYGFLFRENTILNNVSSPTKYAEYILCGLPLLVSEGIGDYSEQTEKLNLGVLISDSILKDPGKFDFQVFLKKNFDHQLIAQAGKKYYSKNSIIDRIMAELES